MSTNDIVREIEIAAPPEKVWGFLTQPDKLAVWFHAPKTPLEKGSPYELFGTESGDKLCWGEVLTQTEFTELSYTFAIAPFAGVMTTVNWTLKETDTGTMLTLRHVGFDALGEASGGLHDALSNGWDDHLKRLVDGV